MKIIEKGKPNRQNMCFKCRTKYEYEENDLYYIDLVNSSDTTRRYSKIKCAYDTSSWRYVQCPVCQDWNSIL